MLKISYGNRRTPHHHPITTTNQKEIFKKSELQFPTTSDQNFALQSFSGKCCSNWYLVIFNFYSVGHWISTPVKSSRMFSEIARVFCIRASLQRSLALTISFTMIARMVADLDKIPLMSLFALVEISEKEFKNTAQTRIVQHVGTIAII